MYKMSRRGKRHGSKLFESRLPPAHGLHPAPALPLAEPRRRPHPLQRTHELGQAAKALVAAAAIALLAQRRTGTLGSAGLEAQLDSAVPGGAGDSKRHTDGVERADLHVEQRDAEQDGEALLDVAADGDGQRARQPVGLERGDVQRKRDEPVAQQRRHRRLAQPAALQRRAELRQLARAPRHCEGLRGRQRRHPQQHLQRRELQAAGHQPVCQDRFD